jgi:Family of unknown function (DUF6522)
MHEGKNPTLCERGVDEEAGRYRLTFFHENRRFRLLSTKNRFEPRSSVDIMYMYGKKISQFVPPRLAQNERERRPSPSLRT